MKRDLTHARLLELLHYDPDFGEFRNRVRRGQIGLAGFRTASEHGRGYRTLKVDGRKYLAHRLAWFYVHGEWPPRGLEIDHVNRVRDDNRISNLRVVTRSENNRNRGSSVKSRSPYYVKAAS